MTNYKTAIRFLATLTALACMAALAGRVHAADLLELNEASVDYKNFALVNPKGRDALIYPDHPKEGININLYTSLFKHGYWESNVETLTNDSQYASIGLQMRLGVDLGRVRLGYYHHSQHVIDRPHAFMDRYPVVDAVEVKIYLYKKGN